MQTEQRPETKITADHYREAAWTAVALLVGLEARPARVFPPSSRLGTSLSPSRPADPRRFPQEWAALTEFEKTAFEARAIAILAGGLAEERVTGGHEGKACLHDAMPIYKILVKSGGFRPLEARAAVVALTKQAKAVLENPATWGAVTRVANALASAGRLTPEEVAELVRGEEHTHVEAVDACGNPHLGVRAGIGGR